MKKENQKDPKQNNSGDQEEVGDSQLASNAGNEPTPIYLTPDSTIQTPEEDRHDKGIDVTKDDSISVSNDDLHESTADRLAGIDGAGSVETE